LLPELLELHCFSVLELDELLPPLKGIYKLVRILFCYERCYHFHILVMLFTMVVPTFLMKGYFKKFTPGGTGNRRRNTGTSRRRRGRCRRRFNSFSVSVSACIFFFCYSSSIFCCCFYSSLPIFTAFTTLSFKIGLFPVVQSNVVLVDSFHNITFYVSVGFRLFQEVKQTVS